MPPRIVILDTNFLLIPFQFKINIMAELEHLLDFSHRYVVSSSTVKELERLGSSKGKEGAGARVALKLLESYGAKVDIIHDERHVDDWIADYSKRTGAIVCTNDSKLRRRLRAFKAKVITLKSKSKLGYV